MLLVACAQNAGPEQKNPKNHTTPPPAADDTGTPPADDSGLDSDDTAGDSGAPDDSGTPPDDSGTPAEDPQYPGDLLDLTNWKITLPVPAEDGQSPLEIEQPELDTYAIDPWFTVSPDHVTFRANAGGFTTSGSSYPRSELREMTDGGAARADWSMTSGVHTMTITEAITHLPEVKPHAVAGQIHDAEDDVVMIRLESTRLYVEGGGVDLGVLDEDYQLGDVFTVRIVATEGRIDVYYQDMSAPKVSVNAQNDGCYFKAGVYTQSNESKGDSADAYGEVAIYDLTVTHE
jgi:hypothetical protein